MFCKKCGKDVPYGVIICEECATGNAPAKSYKPPTTVSRPVQTVREPYKSQQPTPLQFEQQDITAQTPDSVYPPNLPYSDNPGPSSTYPGQPYPYQTTAQTTNNLAIVSLIVSLMGFGPVGIVLGVMARNEINSSEGRQQGQGLATAGIWIGVIQLVALLTMAIVGILFTRSFH